MQASTLTWAPPTGDPVEIRSFAVVEFRAMASPCRVVTDDGDLARSAVAMIADLERRWSRFLPDSEISALNRAGGALCIVSEDTFDLIRRAQLARDWTDGWFNPLVHDRLVALGYGGAADVASAAAGAVCQEPIELFQEIRAVRLPGDARFDPGGLGKGLAADLVAEHLLVAGATAAQVELGGDVRLAGPSWAGGPWHVDIRSPFDTDVTIARTEVDAGAIATSGITRTRWHHGGAEIHHLIDPFTGMPADNDVAQVTAVATELWWAEIIAKTALLRGSDAAPAVLSEHGASGAIVRTDGTWQPVGVPSTSTHPEFPQPVLAHEGGRA